MKHFPSAKVGPHAIQTHLSRVHWVDTDAAGVMHYTNYLRYFEACEEEFYRSISLPFNEVRKVWSLISTRRGPLPVQGGVPLR